MGYKITACCGLRCDQCKAFIATVTNDNVLMTPANGWRSF